MDFGFLNKQVNKITNINELSVLYFKLKKLNMNEHKKQIKLKNEYQNNSQKIDTLMEKIVIKILEAIDKEKEEDDEDDEEMSSDDEEELKSDDIQLLSESDDE